MSQGMTSVRGSHFTMGLLVVLSLALMASVAINGALGWKLEEARRVIDERDVQILDMAREHERMVFRIADWSHKNQTARALRQHELQRVRYLNQRLTQLASEIERLRQAGD